jgi:hypothetical protein
MKEIIDVFRMDELNFSTRIRTIILIGEAVNRQFSANITDELVNELVSQLGEKRTQAKAIHGEDFDC